MNPNSFDGTMVVDFLSLKRAFAREGLEFFSRTPIFSNSPRGKEIQVWLNRYNDIESFVILDDDNDMEHLSPYLVQTTSKDGFTKLHLNKAIKILNKEI